MTDYFIIDVEMLLNPDYLVFRDYDYFASLEYLINKDNILVAAQTHKGFSENVILPGYCKTIEHREIGLLGTIGATNKYVTNINLEELSEIMPIFFSRGGKETNLPNSPFVRLDETFILYRRKNYLLYSNLIEWKNEILNEKVLRIYDPRLYTEEAEKMYESYILAKEIKDL